MNPSPDSSDTLHIETPENVAFGYTIAGIGSRFLAALVDTILIGLLQVIVLLVALALARLLLPAGAMDLDGENPFLAWIIGIAGLISFAFLWGYYIFFEMLWNGQTPGKRRASIRVIRVDGTPITLTESIIRNLVRLIDFLPAYYGVGVVTMFVNEQSRRLGDLAAGTLVVRESGAPITLESLAARVTDPQPVYRPIAPDLGPLPVEMLTPQDIQLLEDFHARRNHLANHDVLGRRILQKLLERMNFPPKEYDRWETDRLLTTILRASKGQIRDAEPPPPTT
ncbi:MAG TPA: RDD family protein [Anaerolineales bacterium]|nr:RDD family protein [Anaerolineales bacterium]